MKVLFTFSHLLEKQKFCRRPPVVQKPRGVDDRLSMAIVIDLSGKVQYNIINKWEKITVA